MSSPWAGTCLVICTLGLCLATPGTSFAQVSDGTAAARAEFDRGRQAEKQKQNDLALAAFRKAVEIDPSFLEAHSQFVSSTYRLIDKREEAKARLRTIYGEWLAANPKNAVLHYFLGTFEANPDKAASHFVKAVEIDPRFADAYDQLALDAGMRGDSSLSSAYYKKAAAARPGDPKYLFSYAYSLCDRDPREWTRLALSVVDRFPNTDRAAQALYWLGEKAPATAERILYFERLRREFAPGKFSWSESGMQSLFAIYAKTDPGKALALARDLVAQKVESHVKWNEVAAMQENVVAARKLLNERKPADALALLQKTTAPKYVLANQVRLLTAEAETAVGQGEKAYNELADFVTAEAHEDLYNALFEQGHRTGRSAAQVKADVQARREKQAKPADEFELENYLDGSKVSLTKYRGKVVLLNFWYPG